MLTISEKCLSDCVLVHEDVHVDQEIRADRWGECRGIKRGWIIQTPIEEINAAEREAYQAEVDCLMKKLKALENCDACKPLVKDRLDKINKFRKRYD